MERDSPILLILDLDETLIYATEEPVASMPRRRTAGTRCTSWSGARANS
jgi:hypothetical protein